MRDDKYFLAEQKRSVRKMESIQHCCKSTFLQNWLPEKGAGEGVRAPRLRGGGGTLMASWEMRWREVPHFKQSDSLLCILFLCVSGPEDVPRPSHRLNQELTVWTGVNIRAVWLQSARAETGRCERTADCAVRICGWKAKLNLSALRSLSRCCIKLFTLGFAATSIPSPPAQPSVCVSIFCFYWLELWVHSRRWHLFPPTSYVSKSISSQTVGNKTHFWNE